VGSTEIAWTVTSTRDKSSEVCRESDVSVPEDFAIKQNYPNPFNPATTIGYQLSAVNDFELVIYNKLGKIVRSLVSEVRPEGAYKINWDGCDNTGEPVSTDVYLYCLKAGSFIQAHKMVLLR